ncbi:hypothetical protein, conserved [Plasmodium gonderi]|uniref:Uncharacterized protein n=1 Tax=Plasmodium gonderi TaxID=77519 RepID=A0A1Y1JTZ1_PLAGO|nr:hypothetical protein, conserved [Plasmodium gonderi]GAW83873.1 hypothetical protein, conserved [Plasmodium gonderi]
MTQEWKNTILCRLKQRNAAQSEKYEEVLNAYNSLVEEKNKLLAIIASFTSENIYLLNSKKFGIPFDTNEYLIPNNLKQYHLLNEEVGSGSTFCHDNNSIHVASVNGTTTETTLRIIQPKIKTKSQEEYHPNEVSKREFLEIIKEKAKCDELILLLKNNINEKEKLLNILNKHNKALNSVILKREQELSEKNKKIHKLQDIVSKQNKDLKLYVNTNISLKRKIKKYQKKNQKMIKDFDTLRLSYIKISKEAYQLKNCKINMDKEYFTLRKQFLAKKIENEKLLKSLLRCKKSYKSQLMKMYYHFIRHNETKELVLSEKKRKIKTSFFKKQKFFISIYWDKLYYTHGDKKKHCVENTNTSELKTNLFINKKKNSIAKPMNCVDAEELITCQNICYGDKFKLGKGCTLSRSSNWKCEE